MAHVTFIHGLANKPPKNALLKDWLGSLAGRDGGGLDLEAHKVSVEMVYWADVLYEKPGEVDEEAKDDEASRDANLEMAITRDLDSEEQQFVSSLERQLEASAAEVRLKIAAEDASTGDRAFPLPKPLERRLMKSLVRDAHHYLHGSEFEPRPGERFDVRQELRDRFVAAIAEGNKKQGPHVVVSHSMGTIIAYDCLKHIPECDGVDALITIGSPLGLSEVQDGFGSGWTKKKGFPDVAKLAADRWLNFYDRLDLVCFADPKIKQDYRLDDEKVVEDIRVRNVGKWRHAIREYLARDRLRDRLKGLLGI